MRRNSLDMVPFVGYHIGHEDGHDVRAYLPPLRRKVGVQDEEADALRKGRVPVSVLEQAAREAVVKRVGASIRTEIRIASQAIEDAEFFVDYGVRRRHHAFVEEGLRCLARGLRLWRRLLPLRRPRQGRTRATEER